MTYHIFLSHSKQDIAFVQQVYRDLRSKGLHVWIDESGLPPGDPSWRRTIATAIRESGCVVVLFSPAAAASEWVQAELEYAVIHEKRVIPVLIKGSERESIPFGYVGAQRIDLRNAKNYGAGVQQLVKTAYGDNAIFESPTVHAALGKTLVSKPSATRPSKSTADLKGNTPTPSRRRWWWLARLFRAKTYPLANRRP